MAVRKAQERLLHEIRRRAAMVPNETPHPREVWRQLDDACGLTPLPAKPPPAPRKPPEMAPEVYANIVWSCG